jgi:transcriptional regulator with XRE-family HTH domain
MQRIQAEFGARVRELRIERGWTQEELASAAGRHWTYVGGIERGERNVTLQVVSDIARGLGVDVQELFRGVGQAKKKS